MCCPGTLITRFPGRGGFVGVADEPLEERGDVGIEVRVDLACGRDRTRRQLPARSRHRARSRRRLPAPVHARRPRVNYLMRHHT